MAKLAVAALALLILIPAVIAAVVSGVVSAAVGGSDTVSATAATVDCVIGGLIHSEVDGYQADQLGNAATIVAVGKQLGVPEQGWVVAITAAITESGLRNLNYGDRDSLGLFQQRPSQGWGSPSQIMTPTYAATQFYQHLLALPDWQGMSVNDAAQAVQRSGRPTSYGPHVQAAREIVAAVSGVRCAASPASPVVRASGGCDHLTATNPRAVTAAVFACTQRGRPYVWAGTGTSGFDCSGLTAAAYAAAGITLPHNAQQQYDTGPLLPAGTPLQPGDLVFYGAGPNDVSHVGVAISATQMIDAPHTGTVVRIDDVGDYLAASRPTLTPRH